MSKYSPTTHLYPLPRSSPKRQCLDRTTQDKMGGSEGGLRDDSETGWVGGWGSAGRGEQCMCSDIGPVLQPLDLHTQKKKKKKKKIKIHKGDRFSETGILRARERERIKKQTQKTHPTLKIMIFSVWNPGPSLSFHSVTFSTLNKRLIRGQVLKDCIKLLSILLLSSLHLKTFNVHHLALYMKKKDPVWDL